MYLYLLGFLFILGCETPGIVVRETPLNISETRKVVVSIIGNPRRLSENGREIFSEYYDRKGFKSDNVERAKERMYTRIIILGDRRPYDIKVEVLVERKIQDDKYELVDKDDKKAEIIAAKLKEALYESHNRRNVIDDFRAL